MYLHVCDNLCFLIRIISPLTFNVDIDMIFVYHLEYFCNMLFFYRFLFPSYFGLTNILVFLLSLLLDFTYISLYFFLSCALVNDICIFWLPQFTFYQY